MKTRSYITLLGIIAVLLAISSVIYYNTKEDKKRSYENTGARMFTYTITPVYELPLYLPITDFIIKEDYFYLKDAANQQIIQIDKSGNIIQKWGGIGDGPKENLRIMSFDVDQQGYLTVDQEKNTVSKVSFEGDLLFYYKPDVVIEKGVFTPDAQKVITKGSKGEFGSSRLAFYAISPTEKQVVELNTLAAAFPDANISDWLYDGLITRGEDGFLYYFCYYANMFVKFDASGKVIYTGNVIYNVPPILFQQVGDAIFPVENEVESLTDVMVTKNYIYILSNVMNTQTGNARIVDVYDVKDGGYVNSFAVPFDKSTGNPPSEMFVDNDHTIYFLLDKNIIGYKISK